jgi:NAD(P)H dehydrogenase (quinone)
MIVVTAASGKLGHAVASLLEKQHMAQDVRLAARNAQKLELWRKKGFSIVTADYEDGRSMAAAYKGADAALIISSTGADVTRIRQHSIAIDAAIASGVRHIVYTSAVNAVAGSKFLLHEAHQATEKYLRNSGISFTILRVSAYFSNFDYLFSNAKECGKLFFPSMEAKVAYVTQQDVAAAALVALTHKEHAGKTYCISGEQAVSAIDMAALFSTYNHHPIEAVGMPPEEFYKRFTALGMPDHQVKTLVSFYEALGAGEYAQTSNDLYRITARLPTSARMYLSNWA